MLLIIGRQASRIYLYTRTQLLPTRLQRIQSSRLYKQHWWFHGNHRHTPPTTPPTTRHSSTPPTTPPTTPTTTRLQPHQQLHRRPHQQRRQAPPEKPENSKSTPKEGKKILPSTGGVTGRQGWARQGRLSWSLGWQGRLRQGSCLQDHTWHPKGALLWFCFVQKRREISLLMIKDKYPKKDICLLE